jgi:hypothetical protein
VSYPVRKFVLLFTHPEEQLNVLAVHKASRPFVFRDVAAADSGGQASNFCYTSQRVVHISQSNVTKSSSSAERLTNCMRLWQTVRRSADQVAAPVRYGTQNFRTRILGGTWRNIWLVPSSYFVKNTAFRQIISLPSSCSMRIKSPNL